MFVLSGSPPPSTVACERRTLPPIARRLTHGFAGSCAPMRIGVDAVPSPTMDPLRLTVTVTFGAMRTSAHGSRVTFAPTVVSYMMMWGLLSAAQVSSAAMFEECIVGPIVGAGQ